MSAPTRMTVLSTLIETLKASDAFGQCQVKFARQFENVAELERLAAGFPAVLVVHSGGAGERMQNRGNVGKTREITLYVCSRSLRGDDTAQEEAINMLDSLEALIGESALGLEEMTPLEYVSDEPVLITEKYAVYEAVFEYEVVY